MIQGVQEVGGFLVQLSGKQKNIRHSQPVPSNDHREWSIVLGVVAGRPSSTMAPDEIELVLRRLITLGCPRVF